MRTQVFEKTKMCQDLKDPQMPSVSVDISCPRQVPHPGCLCQRRQLSIRAFPVGPSLSDTHKNDRDMMRPRVEQCHTMETPR
jgi:hypothetical protein